MAVAVSAIGAVLGTLLGVLAGSLLSNRSQSKQWSRDRQADACAQVVRESSNLLIEFTKLVWQPPDPAADGMNVPTPIDWRPWNEALTVLDLVAEHAIVEAAHAIDEQIWIVHQQVKRGWVPVGEWMALRELVDARQQDFVNIARRRLAAEGPVCAENLCHQAIFMDHASCAVVPPDAEVVQVGDIIWQRAKRRGLGQGAVRRCVL